MTGTGSCIVTMDAAKNVSATFIHYTVKLLGIIPLPDKRYVTLGNNYTLDIPVGTTNATLMVQTSTFNEFLTYSLPLTLTINGGKGIDFVTDTGYTVINGSLFIRAGRMNVNKVKIQPRII